ncbi:hypothetical protein J2T13_004055 [Paenibacillus sp. DS2015]
MFTAPLETSWKSAGIYLELNEANRLQNIVIDALYNS